MIREDNRYGGLRVRLTGRIGNPATLLVCKAASRCTGEALLAEVRHCVDADHTQTIYCGRQRRRTSRFLGLAKQRTHWPKVTWRSVCPDSTLVDWHAGVDVSTDCANRSCQPRWPVVPFVASGDTPMPIVRPTRCRFVVHRQALESACATSAQSPGGRANQRPQGRRYPCPPAAHRIVRIWNPLIFSPWLTPAIAGRRHTDPVA